MHQDKFGRVLARVCAESLGLIRNGGVADLIREPYERLGVDKARKEMVEALAEVVNEAEARELARGGVEIDFSRFDCERGSKAGVR